MYGTEGFIEEILIHVTYQLDLKVNKQQSKGKCASTFTIIHYKDSKLI